MTTGGEVDTTFGVNGYRNIHFGGRSEKSSGIAINPHGSILVSGTLSGPDIHSANNGAIVRLVPDGSLDTTFGSLGAVPSSGGAVVEGAASYGYGVAIQDDGKILFVGKSGDQIILARYLGSSEWKYSEAQAIAIYIHFAGIGDTNQGLAYWFYYNALRDRDKLAELGYPAYAQYKYYEGLGYYYYTALTGNQRIALLYQSLAYAWYFYLLEAGDVASANYMFNLYFLLSQAFS